MPDRFDQTNIKNSLDKSRRAKERQNAKNLAVYGLIFLSISALSSIIPGSMSETDFGLTLTCTTIATGFIGLTCEAGAVHKIIKNRD